MEPHMPNHIHHPGSKDAWETAHKDQPLALGPVANIDEEWDGEIIVLEI